MRTVLVSGGSGYVGGMVVRELVEAGIGVRVLDSLVHGQAALADRQEAAGVEVLRGDLRDAAARRSALAGADAVVHLAAIVGDPACAGNPTESDAVNVGATRALLDDACAAGVGHLVFASTCANYGRMADLDAPITEEGELAPVSLYAEQKVRMERLVLAANGSGGSGADGDADGGDGGREGGLQTTCLRFATIYGVAPRMRFDLTVNEFTRDLWAGRRLEVFGEQFWRPYAHVSDAARAVRIVLEAAGPRVAGEVFNVGCSEENYRKSDLIEIIRRHTDRGAVSYVDRDEDPRDYKVSFEKIRRELGFATAMTVGLGVSELLGALDAHDFGDPFDGRHRNTP